MNRWKFVTALVVATGAVAAVALAGATQAEARQSYCSSTGDYCTSTARLDGVVFLRVGSFSLRGRVRICVTDPYRERVCHSFPLRRLGSSGIYEARARWHRNYPHSGPGRYRVAFFAGRTRLGPVLDFVIPRRRIYASAAQ